MEMERPPTLYTEEILIAYLHSRVGDIDPLLHTGAATEMAACLYQMTGINYGGNQPQRAQKIVESLNIIRKMTVDCDDGITVPQSSFCGSALNEGENERREQIRLIFCGSITWPKLVALLEYFLAILMDYLEEGDVQTATKAFGLLFCAMNWWPLGDGGESIAAWLERRERWNEIDGVAATLIQRHHPEGAVQGMGCCGSSTTLCLPAQKSAPSATDVGTGRPQRPPSPRGLNRCKACGRPKARSQCTERGKCECGVYHCLLPNCTFEAAKKKDIDCHLRTVHYNCSPSNQCAHCGGAKVRDGAIIQRCPECPALWCGIGNCRFESISIRAVQEHQNTCDRIFPS